MQFRVSTLVYHFVTCNLFDQTARFYWVLIRDPSLIWNTEKLEVRQGVSKNVPVCDVQYINFLPGRQKDKDSDSVVVISSSSSDDDSDKEQKTNASEPVIKKESDAMELSIAKDEKPAMETDLQDQTSNEQPPKQENTLLNVKTDGKDSDSDECISQEDLLAQLGLSSVKELHKKETSGGESTALSTNANGVDKKPVITHRARESIVDFLKVPKLTSLESKRRVNGEAKTDISVANGDNGDGSRPDSPLSDENDDDLQAKEKLIAHLRNELRQEEAKLLLLKKLHAAQNDVKGNSKLQKENVLEKAPAAVPQSNPVKSSTQLPSKKGQNLPPPPPLKASTVLASSTFHPPRDIPGQPRILPKGNSAAQAPPSSSTKFVGSAAQTLKEFAVHQQSIQQQSTQPKPGSSAIADLQNVVTCMANLIQPTPLYPHGGGRGSPVYSAANQPAPVRPTPVRANNVSSLPASSGYVSFQHHLPSSSQQSTGGKQAAAKMALRKQLERTLLQIPPPKPPPPEWSFIPSLGSPDFMLLVGLESVVNVLADKETKKSNAPLQEQKINPNVCSRCNTDFSPSWTQKQDSGSGMVTVCEKCSTVNVKKELKSEHTARLKAAFLKALKQEQEIEQEINDSPTIAPKPHHQSQKTSPQPPLAPAPPRHHIAHHQPIMHHHHQAVQPGLYHHHQPHNSLLFQLQQQHLQQQHQELEAAARQQADVRWHPYLSQHHHSGSRNPQHHHSYVSDSDRQYLLDMIPSLPTPTLGYGSSRI